VAPSGERIRRKGRHGVFAGKTVRSMPERFEIYIVYKRRYINTLPFLSYVDYMMKCLAVLIEHRLVTDAGL